MLNHLKTFDQQWQIQPVSANAPVFILSAGWRSGSTLLQRLICSSKEVVVWGEPYARCELVQHLTQSAAALNTEYPKEGHQPDLSSISDLENKWIANLFPSSKDLKASYRAALDGLLARPAFRDGYARFGMKEVRLDAARGEPDPAL